MTRAKRAEHKKISRYKTIGHAIGGMNSPPQAALKPLLNRQQNRKIEIDEKAKTFYLYHPSNATANGSVTLRSRKKRTFQNGGNSRARVKGMPTFGKAAVSEVGEPKSTQEKSIAQRREPPAGCWHHNQTCVR